MDLALLNQIAALKAPVYAAGLLPVCLALIMWLSFYIKFDLGRLKKIGAAFEGLADKGEELTGRGRENLVFMDGAEALKPPACFSDALLRMRSQIERSYKGAFIPEARTFYDFDELVEVPGCRSRLSWLWRSFWVLGLMTLGLPVLAALLSQAEALGGAMVLGGLLFILLCLFQLLFTLMDQEIYFGVKSEYHRFIDTFDRILPVAKAEVAMLLEATERNQRVYLAAADSIVTKFDSVVDELLLPLLEDSIETIMRSNVIPAIQSIDKTLDLNMSKTFELQEKGMERMTAAFADRLGDTVEAKMRGLAESIEGVRLSMAELNSDTKAHAMALTKTIDSGLALHERETAKISSAFSEALRETMESQTARLALSVGDINGRMAEFNLSLGEHVTALKDTTAQSLELQKEQTARSLALQEEQTAASLAAQTERIAKLMELQELRLGRMMEDQERRSSQMLGHQEQRSNQMLDTQAKAMSGLVSEFSEALSSRLRVSVSSLNQELEGLHTRLGSLNEKLAANIGGLTDMLADQRQLMEKSAEMLMDSSQVQERTLTETREIQAKSVENSLRLNEQVEAMSGILGRLTEQTMAFSGDALRFTRETAEAQQQMSHELRLSQDKLEAAVLETMSMHSTMSGMISEMLDNVSGRMNEAMINAGREIASGIKDVTADNAEAIAGLTEQAAKLRDDYEAYFSRIEDSASKTIDDMDFEIRSITARITEDIGAMMEQNTSANADILERYRDSTIDLLQSFDEQARSISLYAKEINMDISGLSDNLRLSVEDFSQKMSEGVNATLSEFDGGLSQLSLRIANTVESISEAVEALPEALRRE